MCYMCRMHTFAHMDHPHKTTNVTEALMFRITSDYIISHVILYDHQLKLFNRGVSDVEDDGVMDHI